MVTSFGGEDGKILDHIKTARETIKEELISTNCLVFAPHQIIEKNNDFLSKQLNLTDLSFLRRDLREENINKAAKFFLYLNACNKREHLKDYFEFLYFQAIWEPKGTFMPMPRPLKEIILSFWKIYHETSTGDNKTISKAFLDMLYTKVSVENVSKNDDSENNHPVHILKSNGNLSQSAFIPFCSFGEDMAVMGVKHEAFNSPVCNSFEAVIHKDQLCYQIDLEKYKDTKKIKRQLQHGLVLLLDYNEERDKSQSSRKRPKGQFIFSPDKDISSQIFLDTISNILYTYLPLISRKIFFFVF